MEHKFLPSVLFILIRTDFDFYIYNFFCIKWENDTHGFEGPISWIINLQIGGLRLSLSILKIQSITLCC